MSTEPNDGNSNSEVAQGREDSSFEFAGHVEALGIDPPPSDEVSEGSTCVGEAWDSDEDTEGSARSGEGDIAVLSENDIDSDYTSSERSTTTLDSSTQNYIYENGRRYNSVERGYPFPNDGAEQDRLELQHCIFNKILRPRSRHDPPAKNALDVGTGRGLWVINYANKYPQAQVTGVDLSPIQPMFVPPNVKFEVDDMEKDWTFRKKFDLIRCWGMEASFAERQRFMERAFRHLEPGGRLVTQALVKFSCSKYAPGLGMWWNLICKAAGEAGRPMGAASMHKNLMVDAGFVGVRKRAYKWPVNSQLTGESAGDIKWRILEFMETFPHYQNDSDEESYEVSGEKPPAHTG